MANLPVYDKTGKQVGSYDIEPTDLCPSIDRQLLHDAVVMYQANRRQGSFRTRTRSEVKGSTKKMYRQKGTGHARAGSKRSGIRRGGGHIFAKRPRDFSYRLPRKALQKATRMAMAGKLRDEQVLVVDELSMETPRTAEIVSLLKALQLDGHRTLIATDSYNPVVYKSARNLPGVSVEEVRELNPLSILHPQRILITRAALDAMKQAAARSTATASQDA
jgi:large subunit ribosomal protein L4